MRRARAGRWWGRVACGLLCGLMACSGPSAATPTPLATAPPTATASVAAPSLTVTAQRTATATGSAQPTSGRSPVGTPDPQACAPGVALLGFSDALDKLRYADTDLGGLSGLAYDATSGDYLAVVDNQGESAARVYRLRLPLDGGKLGTPSLVRMIALLSGAGAPFTGRNFDGEGLALLPNGELLISSETEPSIRRFAVDGRLLGEVAVPTRFRVKPDGEATANQTFESLALAPDGRALFAAVEGPLAADGFAPGLQGRVRILRYDGGPDFVPAAQYFYLAETAQGVADIVALSDSELLVLERGFIPGLGNTIRVYRVALADATDVTDRASLAEPDLTPLTKELLFDLGKCPPGGATHPGRQGNPLLDNFEALALGPALPDGRRLLWLLSDDNFGADQVTRVIALAWGR